MYTKTIDSRFAMCYHIIAAREKRRTEINSNIITEDK